MRIFCASALAIRSAPSCAAADSRPCCSAVPTEWSLTYCLTARIVKTMMPMIIRTGTARATQMMITSCDSVSSHLTHILVAAERK
jgi:hypothetical protein